ncbi:hypothetical protein K2X40_00625 [Candidatus Babeliales bacterium]|nr:hypothetical protein [Candidatus Babeliales bacterium]
MNIFYALFFLLWAVQAQGAASEKGSDRSWRKNAAFFQECAAQQLAPSSGPREFGDDFIPDWGLCDDEPTVDETSSLSLDQAVDLCLADSEVPAQSFHWRKYLTKITKPFVTRVGSVFRGFFDYDFTTPAGQKFRVRSVHAYRERDNLVMFFQNGYCTIFFPVDSSLQEYEGITVSDGDESLFKFSGWQANNFQLRLDREGGSLFFARERNRFFDDIMTLEDDGMQLHFLNDKVFELSFAQAKDLFGPAPWRVMVYLEGNFFIAVRINDHIAFFSKITESFPCLDVEKLSGDSLKELLILKESKDYGASLPYLAWFLK